MPRAVVVIPTYNEVDNIVRLVPEVLAQLPDAEVLIVDDDSPDGTADAVAALGVRDPRVLLLRHGPKIGIGPAYKAGFEQAMARRPDYVIQMDADFSHPPAMLPEFVRLAAEHDLVLGSRYVNGITVVNWPIERLLLSYFGNVYVRRILSLPVRDATGGFKCWRREALERIDVGRVRSNGYAFQIETTYRAWKAGCSIHEVPILFLDRTTGDSKMTRRIGMEALWIVWWLRASAALGRL
ncbi:MAG TPA: polyprenol monophosphomannose synthase [Candidatus Limnocylindria bacterium]|nr:polyprenol monophosphomannose synthase [Candidatus Limnocylindria bacterium]